MSVWGDPCSSLLWQQIGYPKQSELGLGKSMRGPVGGGLFHLCSANRPAGHLELAQETFLKVILVKIDLLWEGMENSCSCPRHGAREANDQAKSGQGTQA